jgi:hypothetical protein
MYSMVFATLTARFSYSCFLTLSQCDRGDDFKSCARLWILPRSYYQSRLYKSRLRPRPIVVVVISLVKNAPHYLYFRPVTS